MLIYRLAASLAPLLIMPFLNYAPGEVFIVVACTFLGVILGNRSERVLKIQNLTFVVFYALLILGYFQEPGGVPIYRDQILILASAQALSGLYGFFHERKCFAAFFSIGYWALIAIALAQISRRKLGAGGVWLAVALISLVAARDVGRIIKLAGKKAKCKEEDAS